MITADQVLRSLQEFYWGGCAYAFTLLAFRGLLPAKAWDEIQDLYHKHAKSLSGPVMGILIALVLTPLVFLWPIVFFLEGRRRWREWRRSA